MPSLLVWAQDQSESSNGVMNEHSFIIRYWSETDNGSTDGSGSIRFHVINTENDEEVVFNNLQDLFDFIQDFFEA